jgi:hypothetical protein
MGEHKSVTSRRLFWRIVKDMFDFKRGFIEVYAVLELNNCLTLYLCISANYLVCIDLWCYILRVFWMCCITYCGIWIMTLYSGRWTLSFKMNVTVSFFKVEWRQYIHPKHWYLPARLHGVITQKNTQHEPSLLWKPQIFVYINLFHCLQIVINWIVTSHIIDHVGWFRSNILGLYLGVVGLNVNCDTWYPDWSLLWFSSVSSGKCQVRTLIRLWLYYCRTFPIHQSSYHSTPSNLKYDSILK